MCGLSALPALRARPVRAPAAPRSLGPSSTGHICAGAGCRAAAHWPAQVFGGPVKSWLKPAAGDCVAGCKELPPAEAGSLITGSVRRGANRAHQCRSAVVQALGALGFPEWTAPSGWVFPWPYQHPAWVEGGRVSCWLQILTQSALSVVWNGTRQPTRPKARSHAGEPRDLQTAAAVGQAAAPRGCLRNNSRSPRTAWPLEFRGPSRPAPSPVGAPDLREVERADPCPPITLTWKQPVKFLISFLLPFILLISRSLRPWIIQRASQPEPCGCAPRRWFQARPRPRRPPAASEGGNQPPPTVVAQRFDQILNNVIIATRLISQVGRVPPPHTPTPWEVEFDCYFLKNQLSLRSPLKPPRVTGWLAPWGWGHGGNNTDKQSHPSPSRWPPRPVQWGGNCFSPESEVPSPTSGTGPWKPRHVRDGAEMLRAGLAGQAGATGPGAEGGSRSRAPGWGRPVPCRRGHL